jgi:hypothetical protein
MRVRVVVHRVDAPGVAGAVVVRVADAVDHRIAQVDVGRRHVDLQPQHVRAVGNSPARMRRNRSRFSATLRSRCGLGLPGSVSVPRSARISSALRVDIREAVLDQRLGEAVQRLEVVRRVVQVARPSRSPATTHGVEDRVDVLLLFLRRVRVVEPHVAGAAVVARQAEVQADRLRVADVQIAVRLGREARADSGGVLRGAGLRGAGPGCAAPGAGRVGVAREVARSPRLSESTRWSSCVAKTGSGKTTQLPKICLELGRGVAGLIGHTQPRRIAARATATRIAQELKRAGPHRRLQDPLHRRIGPQSYIKLMTDGILLAETQTDPLLRQYDTLIIDEAHERSLNIDFLLGYLRQCWPRGRELKLIVTSATLDAERFSPALRSRRHARPGDRGVRPPISDRDALPAVERDEPKPSPRRTDEPGQPRPGPPTSTTPSSMRWTRRTAAAPATCWCSCPASARSARPPRPCARHHPPGLEDPAPVCAPVGPGAGAGLRPHQGRRVVLATNVAETSLTVPGIRYVIDTGLARVKRYSHRNKVEQLQVEPISQAAASQRAGRCGRVSGGRLLQALRRRGLQQTPGLHRAGDPALVPGRRDPAHEVLAPRRCGGLPLPRGAAAAHGRRRLSAAGRAGRGGRGEQGT